MQVHHTPPASYAKGFLPSLSKDPGMRLGTGAEGPGMLNREDPQSECSPVAAPTRGHWRTAAETALDLIYAN